MIARAVVNSANMKQKDVKIASGLLSLMAEVSIKADTAFLAAFVDKFLDTNFL
jgi:hypothetical protein